jgi:crossover junction endodeoxyribonuclease RusA
MLPEATTSVQPVCFTVSGAPVPQPRPRILKNGHRYTPDNGIHGYRERIALAARAAGASPTTHAPVTLVIDLVFERPRSHFLANGQLNPRTALPVPPGDCSNYQKGVEDSLNGVAWVDDRQVAKTVVEKRYGPEACTRVQIW